MDAATQTPSTLSLDDEEKLSIGTETPDVPASPSSPVPITRSVTNGSIVPSPDGGLRAWSQVLACFIVNALTWGTTYSFGVCQLHYTTTLGLPSSQISWIGSIQVFLVFACCTLSGRLTDAGFARETAAVGCTLATLGAFLASLSKEYWQIMLTQGVCMGLGMGLVFMPAVAVTGTYFQKRRAFALAIAACGSGFGGLVFPSTLQYLSPKIGFPRAMRCAGFVMMTFSVLAVLLLKPRVVPRRAGPWMELSAFKELPYCLFTLGSFLNFYGVYFAMFYVSTPDNEETQDQGLTGIPQRSIASLAMSSDSAPPRLSVCFSSPTPWVFQLVPSWDTWRTSTSVPSTPISFCRQYSRPSCSAG